MPTMEAASAYVVKIGRGADGDSRIIDFPTLWVMVDWQEAHCILPDSFGKGAPFVQYSWQLWCTANHYRVKPGATVGQLAPAFHYRRSQVVGPQKALALDTPIPTPDGWTTMRDLRPGDMVFDERGDPVRVLDKSRVWRGPTYRVTFSDGASLVACGDHEWWLEERTSSSAYRPTRLTTSQLLGQLVDAGGARRFRVPNARPLNLPERDLPIDPYTLGAWLGDGNSDDGRITGYDRDVFARIETAGYEVRGHRSPKRVGVVGLATQLRAAGLLKNKHIPPAYLRASEKQRWALLQGLMDTDGHADHRGRCEFTTVLPALRDGVVELLRSLGLKSLCYAGAAMLNGRITGPKWRISFAARRDLPVFGLERKQERLKSPGGAHAQFEHRRIVAVERIRSVPTQCITVDSPSHVFLAGKDMIPTGNSGKSPWVATLVCGEAVGPAVFHGWARGGELYRCSEWGCGCGWSYEYRPGEPMGRPWPTPLIQITATAQEQVDNIYAPLQAMIRYGPLGDLMRVGEEFVRLPNDGRIDAVTASAKARLGNPVTFVVQDETGLYTKQNKLLALAQTQRRGAAGMGGRTVGLTNPWDPSEDSDAQRTFESSRPDIFKFHREPKPSLKYTVKEERRKIHRYVYAGSEHVDLDAIEAEAAELLEKDPEQAERFYGNRIVYGGGSYYPDTLWKTTLVEGRHFKKGTEICLGFDGSEVDDWTAFRAEDITGHRFTPRYGDGQPTVWKPEQHGGKVPRDLVHAALDEISRYYKIVRLYGDPPGWWSELGEWAAKYGEERVYEWWTNRIPAMHQTLEQSLLDYSTGRSTHDDCPDLLTCWRNARKRPRPNQRYILGKPSQHQKIDVVMADALAHKAASDARADGWVVRKPAIPRRIR